MAGQEEKRTDRDAMVRSGGHAPDSGRKPYAPPVLIRWGTLGDITQTTGWRGKNDGGVPSHGRKTR